MIELNKSKLEESFKKVLNEWEINRSGPEVQMVKNSFWHNKEFWEQEPKLANAVSNLLFGFNAFDIDDYEIEN
jgi:predicted HNH restriction endonuclease